VVAHSDLPEAIFFNPALITRLAGTQASLGTTLIFPDREFKSALTGVSEETEDSYFYPSTFYLTHTITDKVSIGLGVFSPFGLGTDWPDDWEGRYLATKSTITTFNINPTLACQLNPAVSIAAGIDFVLLDASLESRLNLAALTGGALPDANRKFEGDGNGVGYNLGLLIDLTDDLAFGASYRSEVKIDVDGEATFELPTSLASSVPEPFLSAVREVLANADAKTDLTLPAVGMLGLAYSGIDRLVIEIGMRWEDWSSFDALVLVLDNGNVDARRKDWHDTISYNLGGTYRVNDRVALLAGYLYAPSAVPHSTLEPAVPDSVSHLLCLGTDLTFGHAVVSLSYGYQHLEPVKKHNTLADPLSQDSATRANGRYESDLHLAGLSVSYQF
jgi:long-chain fatty acid transport protein